jgi:hypothetical protein
VQPERGLTLNPLANHNPRNKRAAGFAEAAYGEVN